MSLCYDFQKWIIVSLAMVTIGLFSMAYGFIPKETVDKLTVDESSYIYYQIYDKCLDSVINGSNLGGFNDCTKKHEQVIRETAEDHDKTNNTMPRNIPFSVYCKLNVTRIAKDICQAGSNIASGFIPSETRYKLTTDESSYISDIYSKCLDLAGYNYTRDDCIKKNEQTIKETAQDHDKMNNTMSRNIPFSTYCELNLTRIAKDMCEAGK